jgi:leucyl-tRNA synthetase
MYEKGLAYRKNAPVNWCPNENTVLANEDVNDGRCWRCDAVVEKRDMLQWFFKITAYADKLLEGLDRIDWPEGVKTQQRDWIGKSEGVELTFLSRATMPGFVSYHPCRYRLRHELRCSVAGACAGRVDNHCRPACRCCRVSREGVRLSDMDRTAEGRERTGVFTGAYGVNPVSGHRIPIYIADYVLTGYGNRRDYGGSRP